MKHLPNLLSALRIAAVPALALLAWHGHASAFVALLALTLLSDVADGIVARHHGVESPLGAKLDSWGDLAIYTTLPLFAWWLWPEVLRAESRWLALALFAYFVPTLAGLARFRRLTSYHTWMAKATAVLMGAGALVLFSGGPSWPFHLATLVLCIEALEELCITAVLPRWTSDVRSLRQALRLQAAEARQKPALAGTRASRPT